MAKCRPNAHTTNPEEIAIPNQKTELGMAMLCSMNELNDQSETSSSIAKSIRPARVSSDLRAIASVKDAEASRPTSGTVAVRFHTG